MKKIDAEKQLEAEWKKVETEVMRLRKKVNTPQKEIKFVNMLGHLSNTNKLWQAWNVINNYKKREHIK